MADRINSIEEREQKTMKHARAILSEQFADCLIICRVKGGIYYNTTDATWAIEAARRYTTIQDEEVRTIHRDQDD